jgi:hypothetical protein
MEQRQQENDKFQTRRQQSQPVYEVFPEQKLSNPQHPISTTNGSPLGAAILSSKPEECRDSERAIWDV